MSDLDINTNNGTTTEILATESITSKYRDELQETETSNLACGKMSNVEKPYRTIIRGKKTDDRDKTIQ